MMHHRNTVRAQTDVRVTVHADGVAFPCRAVDLSTDGLVVEPARALSNHTARSVYWLELPLGEAGIVVLARPAWRNGNAVAFRFIDLSECDRLTLAEHMDASLKLGLTLH